MKAYRVMANEKRFENIRKSLVNLYHAVDIDKETKQYIFNDLKIEWLIERAQELEKQNKRYREAIEKAIEDLENECLWDALVRLKELEGDLE